MRDIIYFILLILLMAFLSYRLVKPTLLHFIRQQNYRKILRQINALYERDNTYPLAQHAKKQTAQYNEELTYGEIEPCTLLDLLAVVKPKPSARFYDLGSGNGKAALTAKLRYPTLIVRGIEIIPALQQLSEQKCQQLRDLKSFPHFDIHFICGNFLDQDFLDADIIFINATGFSSALFEQLLTKLLNLKPQTKIIITSKTLPETSFIKQYQGMEQMSWGLTSTYIYEKAT
ncbi:MAG: hypothetical protein ACHQJ6_03160 [Candidatus Berkiellales bacterium]